MVVIAAVGAVAAVDVVVVITVLHRPQLMRKVLDLVVFASVDGLRLVKLLRQSCNLVIG